jgi:NAD(P)-dependent dehydrogenase (short-subunit alcohol dehydrogenase family)
MRLAAEGARVAVCGRTQAPLDGTVKKVTAGGGFAKAYRLDVRDAADVDRTVARAAAEVVDARKPRLDLVVNAAGIAVPTPLTTADDVRWHDVLETNLTGAMRVARAALRVMPDGGRVVNIASTLARTGASRWGAYCASKAGLVAWTRVLAAELAPQKISVNAVCPGWVDSDVSQAALVDLATRTGKDAGRLRRRLEEAIPLGRFVDPVEVADLVAFLCGPGGIMITGQAISICGGEALY